MTGGAVAVLHFTAPPAVGGVEGLVDRQCRTLADWGRQPRLIVGRGEAPAGTELALVPAMDPASPEIARARDGLRGRFPDACHPLVEELCHDLSRRLEGCVHCWVHNAFTVYLNPFLTVALVRLSEEPRGIRWVAWCHDLSDASDYVAPLKGVEAVARPLPGVSYVVDSDSRRQDLATWLGVEGGTIQVIPPGLDVLDWPGISTETRSLVQRLDLLSADPLVLVPSKLLPHKNLRLAVRIGAKLAALAPSSLLLITGAPSPHQPEVSRELARSLTALAIELGAADRVVLLSGVTGEPPTRSTVRDLMQLSDLVLLPSEEEGFGMPLLEAATLRVPVLASDIPPFREREATAYFDPRSSPQDVARSALAIAGSPPARARRAAVLSGALAAEGMRSLLR